MDISSILNSIQPTDVAIFLVSFAACIYCFVLSKRLRALQDTKDGLGATITAMTNSVSAMSQATHDTRTRVESMATRLAHLISDGEKMCKRLEDTIMTLERSQTGVTTQVHAAQTELNVMMRDVLDQSRARILEMTTLMRQMRAVSEASQPDITAPAPRAKSA
ncbi:MAG: hypothetical protein ACK4Y9_02365 [Hyphomonas sp.]